MNPSIAIYLDGRFMTVSRRYPTKAKAIRAFRRYPMVLTSYGERSYDSPIAPGAKITAKREEQ